MNMQFSYDNLYHDLIDNSDIYQHSVQKMIKEALNGINGTVFMYGQTGSGKTYTMLGKNNSKNNEFEISFKEDQLNSSRMTYQSNP